MESKIIGYRSIANAEKVIIFGHAFEKHKVIDLHPHHGRRKNLKQTIRRFRAQPLKWTAIDIRLNGVSKRVRTDKNGYFTSEVEHSIKEPGWYPYELFWKRNNKKFASEFYLSDEHETGVISDIDDTLLVSHSTRLIRKMALVLFRNAHSRKTIPFVKNWHAYIKELNESAHPRDFFYVSNSEWNLYDFLVDFFSINELPKGVFFLQYLKKGIRDLISSGKVNNAHKKNSIEFLLKFYPHKKFILVGDNGQKDMDVYREIVEKYNDRIKGVIIRKLPYIKNEKSLRKFEACMKTCRVPFKSFQ